MGEFLHEALSGDESSRRVFLKFSLQGAAFDSQFAGSGADVSFAVPEDALQVFPFDTFQ